MEILKAPSWTIEQLAEESARAMAVFRQERLEEVPDQYSDFFDVARANTEDLLELTRDLLDAKLHSTAAVTLYLEALRYAGAPPISDDDLSTISGVPKGKFATKDGSQKVVEIILQIADRHRFPWLIDGREATQAERFSATLATAAQLASSKLQTHRRNEAKRIQEDKVKEALIAAGYKEVPTRIINTARNFPDPGSFCGESSVGGSKADIVVGLFDDRILCVECKSSNSSVNSYKRIVHEAAGKAQHWISAFGQSQIVPAAVIAGVYNPENLAKAQGMGLSIWWSHAINDMTTWAHATRGGA